MRNASPRATSSLRPSLVRWCSLNPSAAISPPAYAKRVPRYHVTATDVASRTRTRVPGAVTAFLREVRYPPAGVSPALPSGGHPDRWGEQVDGLRRIGLSRRPPPASGYYHPVAPTSMAMSNVRGAPIARSAANVLTAASIWPRSRLPSGSGRRCPIPSGPIMPSARAPPPSSSLTTHCPKGPEPMRRLANLTEAAYNLPRVVPRPESARPRCDEARRPQ